MSNEEVADQNLDIFDVDNVVPSLTDEAFEAAITEIERDDSEHFEKPIPPQSLSERECEIWEETLNSVSPGWIKGKDRYQLTVYCQAIADVEFYSYQVQKLRSVYDPTNKDMCIEMNRMVSQKRSAENQVLSAARQMRINNSGFRDKREAADIAVAEKELWED